MIQAYAVTGLILGLVHLAVVATLTIVTAVRARGRSRALGAAGFGLLTLNQVLQMALPALLAALAGSTGSGVPMLFVVPQVIGVVLSAVALVLLAMALIGVRDTPPYRTPPPS